jgi:histidine triad (HIT) family protein
VTVDDCIFCRIAAGKDRAYLVYEDEQVVAFLDIAQVNPGHVLVVPKQHAENLFDVSRERAGHLFGVAHHIARAILRTFGPDGLTIVQANGEAGGQTVSHLHVHLLPRFADDAVTLTLPPTQPSAETLTQRASRLQQALR